MPTYEVSSPHSGRIYDVDFDQHPSQADAEYAASYYDQLAAQREAEKPGFSFGDAFSGIGDAVGGLRKTLPAAYYRLTEGLSRPDTYSPGARAAFDAEAQYTREMQQESQSRLLQGDASSTGDAFRDTGSSLGFSVGSMAAAIPAGIAGGLAGSKIGGMIGTAVEPGGGTVAGGVLGFVGGAGGAMLGAGSAAYRMAGAQFLDDAFRAVGEQRQARGETWDEPAREQTYQELLPLAQDSALWEAGPEAIGNAVGLGAGKIIFGLGKPLLTGLAKSALGKVGVKAAALATGVGTELVTETATQIGQGLPQAQADAYARGQPMSEARNPYDRPGGVGQALSDIAPQTLALSALMLGGGAVVKAGSLPFRGQDVPPAPHSPAAEVPTTDSTLAIPGLEEHTGDLTAEDVADLDTPPTKPLPKPILQGMPDGQILQQPNSEAAFQAAKAQALKDAEALMASRVAPNSEAAFQAAKAQALKDAEALMAAGTLNEGPSQLADLQTQEIPLNTLQLSKDVPQFKGDANDQGVVEPLKGKYDRLGTGPILIWERATGQREVVSGRHRFDLAKRTGEQTIPGQVVKEADGFTLQDAITADAQLNIRDGHGTIADFANYFRHSGITDAESEAQGLRARAPGRNGWTIGREASQALFDLHANGQLSDSQAVAIARAAPNNEALQRAGVQAIQRGNSAEVAANLVKVLSLEAGTQATPAQLDLFGVDDSAIANMEAMAKKATAFQKQISEQVAAVQGASKRPDQARALGVDVKDPAAVQSKVKELRALQYRWESWPLHPDLAAQVVGEAGGGFRNTLIQRDLQAGFMSPAAAEALIEMGRTAMRAGHSLARWMTEMVKRFGEAVRMYLADAWEAAKQQGGDYLMRYLEKIGALQNFSDSAAKAVPTGPVMRKTRSRFASPDEDVQLYETREDELVREESLQWLGDRSIDQAISAYGNGTVELRDDAKVWTAGEILVTVTAAMKQGTELQQAQARTQAQRMAAIWTNETLSQDPARTMRMRSVVNARLLPYARVLAAENVLIDRAEAALNARLIGGTKAGAEAVQRAGDLSAEDASNLVERVLTAVLGPRLGPRTTIADAVNGIIAGKGQRGEMIDEVAQALMIKARGRVVTPARQSALAALAASLKRTLGASVQGKDIKPTKASDAEVLARAFVDQVAEAQTFREAWEAGRVAVFDMLFDLELDKDFHPVEARRRDALERLRTLEAGNQAQRAASAAERADLSAQIEQLTSEMQAAHDVATAKTSALEAERDRLMPNQPTAAFAPGMAKEAVKRGFEAAGYTAEIATGMDRSGKRTLSMKDALNDRRRASEAVMAVWDNAAANGGISLASWTEGRKLAWRALQEAMNAWQTQITEQEAKAAERTKDALLAKDSPALLKLLNELRGKIAPGMTWVQIFSDMPASQKQRQREIYRRLMLDERLQSLTPDERLALTNELDKHWQRARRAAFKRALQSEGLLPVKDAKDRTKIISALPKLLRMLNLGMMNSQMFREAIAPEYGIRSMTPAQGVWLRNIFEDAYASPEGVIRNDKLLKGLLALQHITGASRAELLNNFWVASVLSGAQTQFETLSTLATGGLRTAMTQAFGLLLRGNATASMQAIAEFWRVMPDAINEAWRILRHGELNLLKRFGDESAMALEGQGINAAITGERLIRENSIGKVSVGALLVWTGRMMSAWDHLNNTASTRTAMVVERALNPELHDGAIVPSAADRAAARAQAEIEVTAGGAVDAKANAMIGKRTREILDAALDPKTVENANELGDIAAYQNDPKGFFGWVYGALNSLFGYAQRGAEDVANWDRTPEFARTSMMFVAGSLRAAMGAKFIRFGANWAADMSSFVPGTYLLQKAGLPVFGMDISRARTNYIMANNVVGLIIGVSFYTALRGLLTKGDDEEGWHMEGGWNNLSADEISQLRTARKEKLTFWKREKDGSVTQFSYRNLPIAGMLAAIGSMGDERRYKPAEWAKHGDAGHFLRALAIGAFQVKDVAAVEGLGAMFGKDTGPGGVDTANGLVDGLNKAAARYVGGFVPTILKDIDAWQDPRLFKPETAADVWIRSLPIARRWVADGRPFLNLLGEPVDLKRAPWNRAVKNYESSEAGRVLGVMIARGWELPEADTNKRIARNGKSVPISSLGAEAEWNYQAKVGEGYRTWLSTEGSKLLQMPALQAQTAIRTRSAAIKTRAASGL